MNNEHFRDQMVMGDMSNINMINLIFLKELHKILFLSSRGLAQRCNGALSSDIFRNNI